MHECWREKKVRQEERERTTDKNVPDSMKQDITLAELKTVIKELKKNNSPGPDRNDTTPRQHSPPRVHSELDRRTGTAGLDGQPGSEQREEQSQGPDLPPPPLPRPTSAPHADLPPLQPHTLTYRPPPAPHTDLPPLQPHTLTYPPSSPTH